ncbi:hypothetical protein FACS1894102_2360 [Spirochaetia bacterium]|nr:hypothetical protein FACS1894102_2360 [Spirochaetia bacterium]
MTQLKECAVGIIERLPEEKMTFVFNILQNVEKAVGKTNPGADKERDIAERQAGLAQFMKYHKTLRADFDYKKELAEYREERYGRTN